MTATASVSFWASVAGKHQTACKPVPVCKDALLEHLLGEGPFDVHHQLEHLVVGLPREQDGPCEQLVDDAPHAPDVQSMICIKPCQGCQVHEIMPRVSGAVQ